MTLTRIMVASAAAALIALNSPTLLEAGKITGFSWTDGIVSIAGIVPPAIVNENNDDVEDGSPLINTLMVLQKDYRGVEHIDIVFEVMDTGGVTEYAIVEGVQNFTGFDWESYHVQLGFGTGADFVMSPPGDGLDFDAPLYNSTISFAPAPGLSFPDVTMSEDVLDADGGPGQPDGAYNEPFVFHIDIPDGIDTFTLRQFPIAAVPEPSSTLLIVMSVCGLVSVRGRRKSVGVNDIFTQTRLLAIRP